MSFESDRLKTHDSEPKTALRRGRRCAEAGVAELLDPLALVGFGDEEIALRIHREVVRAIELPGPVARPAERADNLERLAIEDVHKLVRAVIDEQERLLRIG